MKVINQLRNSFLFQHIDEKSLNDLWRRLVYTVGVYSKGKYINNHNNDPLKKKVGIIIKGRIEVRKELATGKRIIMSQLKVGDMFGMVALFNEEDTQVTSLIAKLQTAVLFIGEEELMKLFGSNQQILKNYLSYINQRICLLNQRIECFSHEPINERVSQYFEQGDLFGKNSEDHLILTKSELADYLGISRPSLYRVLKELNRDGKSK